MAQKKIFYSWQSQEKAVANKFSKALKMVAKQLKVYLDNATRGVPGTPSIVSTILNKIDNCDVYVADLSLIRTMSKDEFPSELANLSVEYPDQTDITNEQNVPVIVAPSKGLPNANVIWESGYARCRLGHERCIYLVAKDTGIAEDLPFDMRGSKIIVLDHKLPPKKLAETIQDAVLLALNCYEYILTEYLNSINPAILKDLHDIPEGNDLIVFIPKILASVYDQMELFLVKNPKCLDLMELVPGCLVMSSNVPNRRDIRLKFKKRL